MIEYQAMLLSDHLADALLALSRARSAVADEKVIHRPAVLHELTRAELSVSRVVGLIAGAPQA